MSLSNNGVSSINKGEKKVHEMSDAKKKIQGTITREDLDEYKATLGKIIYPLRSNETATKDAIRHFADGIGDSNPLWRSEDYARKTRYGSIIAPPFFLNAISEGQAILGLRGVIALYAGAEWEWSRIIRVNDTITAINIPLDIEEKGGEKGNRRFLQTGKITYRNQREDIIATCKWNAMRIESEKADTAKNREQGKNRNFHIYKYNEEELATIYRAYEEEEIRGAEPRYWEDVKVGDELRPVVKGPLSLSDMIAFTVGIGWSRISEAHGLKIARIRKKPGLGYRDPITGALEPMANVHFLDSAAKLLTGIPVPFDLGMQRVCWLGHLLTNWMGDEGFLKKLYARCQNVVIFGDTNWCRGKVSRKYPEKGEHLVQCDIWSENQTGEMTTQGQAIVALPSRGER
jgi:acyl dehydratase